MDLYRTYSKIPVHPDDSILLGIKQLDTIYIDRALPFKFCSAPKLFTMVADGYASKFLAHKDLKVQIINTYLSVLCHL